MWLRPGRRLILAQATGGFWKGLGLMVKPESTRRLAGQGTPDSQQSSTHMAAVGGRLGNGQSHQAVSASALTLALTLALQRHGQSQLLLRRAEASISTRRHRQATATTGDGDGNGNGNGEAAIRPHAGRRYSLASSPHVPGSKSVPGFLILCYPIFRASRRTEHMLHGTPHGGSNLVPDSTSHGHGCGQQSSSFAGTMQGRSCVLCSVSTGRT